MSCALSLCKNRFVLFLAVTLLAVCGFAQTSKKPAASKEPAKPSASGQAGTSTEKPNTEKPKAETGKSETAKPDSDQSSGGGDDQDEPKGPWHGLTWRLIGPFRGGRVLAVSGVVGDTHTYYFGGVGGGVWKTTDGGLSWRPITDKVKDMAPSIGAIAVAPSDPNVIYAGTGEACIRGDIINGNGVYKSIDAGKTWTFSGLRDTRAIGRIVVHPKNPDIAFVAALGHPFGANESDIRVL